MPSVIAAWLSEQEPLQNVTVMTEYPAASKAVPLKHAIIAVGMDSVRLTDKFVENDDGVLERQEYCRSASIRLRFTIHVPFSQGGDTCHSMFTTVLDLLTYASDLNIETSGCEDIAAQRDTDAFVLQAWADVLADFCPADSTGLTLQSFMSKELLCGSHVTNNNIHVSAVEKAFLDEPYRVGTFYGDGTASQTIALGLHPKAVFVAAPQMPTAHPNFSNQSTTIYAAFAIGALGSMGVEITTTGFRVRAGSGVSIGTTGSGLNLAGTQYSYIALV
jgi:hypothetical protein